MAILEKDGVLHGTAGTVVFRRFRDRVVVQSQPVRTKKQTAASEASACEFGLVSTTAAAIRNSLKPVFRNRYDGGMINRFNSAVSRSIRGSKTAPRGQRDLHEGDLSCLEGFEFNTASPLSAVLKVKPLVSLTSEGAIRVQVDALDSSTAIKLPARLKDITNTLRLRLLATAFNFRSQFYEYVASRDLEFIAGETLPPQDLVLEGDIPEGCLVLVTFSLECLMRNYADKTNDVLNTIAFSPAAIIAAFPATNNPAMRQSKEQQNQARKPGNGKKYLFMPAYEGNELLKKLAELEEKRKTGRKKEKLQRGNEGDYVITGPPNGDEADFVVTGKRFDM